MHAVITIDVRCDAQNELMLNVVLDKWSVHVGCCYVVRRAKLPMRPTQAEYTPRSEIYVAQTISSADTDEFVLGAQANDNL